MSVVRSASPRERGQATVEFALCLPLLALALLSVVQIALVVRSQILVVDAARAAARQAAVDPDDGAARAAARSTPGLRSERVEVSIERRGGEPAVVVAHVRYRAPTEVALVGVLAPEPVLESTVVLRSELPGGSG